MTRILRSRAVLAVQDLERSARYWMEVLGFAEDPIRSPGWRFLSRDGFAVMLGECRDEVPASATGNHSWFVHLLVDDVDAFHRDVVARGATAINAPTDRSYGLREFVLETPDGHRVVIGQELAARGA